MEKQEIKECLMEDARAKGICAEGYGQMRAYDRDELIDYYLRTIDWSLECGFPSMKVLRNEFSDIEERGVFVDIQFGGETLTGKQTYVFHHCKGVVNVAMDYENAVIPMLYFANGCNMEVRCEQKNDPAIRVPLYIFGRNKVKAEDNANAAFVRYKKEVVKR